MRARLDLGLHAAGRAADIVLIDVPDGGTQPDALSAIRHGAQRGGGRGHLRRRAAVRRQEPQLAGNDAGDAHRLMRVGAGFFGSEALIEGNGTFVRLVRRCLLHVPSWNRLGRSAT
jgi:hypothetical protein